MFDPICGENVDTVRILLQTSPPPSPNLIVGRWLAVYKWIGKVSQRVCKEIDNLRMWVDFKVFRMGYRQSSFRGLERLLNTTNVFIRGCLVFKDVLRTYLTAFCGWLNPRV